MSLHASDLIQRAIEARREGQLEGAKRDLAEAVRLLRTCEPPADLANALRELGEVERTRRDLDAAERHYEEAVAILRETDEPLKLAHTVRHLGDVHRERGRSDLAKPCYEEALAIYLAAASVPPLDLANAIRPLAILKDDADECQEAAELWEQAHRLYLAVGVAAGAAETARRLSLLAKRAGDEARSQEWQDIAARSVNRN